MIVSGVGSEVCFLHWSVVYGLLNGQVSNKWYVFRWRANKNFYTACWNAAVLQILLHGLILSFGERFIVISSVQISSLKTYWHDDMGYDEYVNVYFLYWSAPDCILKLKYGCVKKSSSELCLLHYLLEQGDTVMLRFLSQWRDSCHKYFYSSL